MLKLMIVDDEETIRAGLSQLVGRLLPEWEVTRTCEDGEAALECLEEAAPDLAIIDIRMPVMDGLELSKELERVRPELHKIILSGHEEFTYLQTAMRYGVADYLLKPIQREELVQAVRKVEARLQERRRRSAARLEKLLLEWIVSQREDRFRELREAFREEAGSPGERAYVVAAFLWEEGGSTGLGSDGRLRAERADRELERLLPGARALASVELAEACTLTVAEGSALPGDAFPAEPAPRCGQGNGLIGFGRSAPFRDFDDLKEAYHRAMTLAASRDAVPGGEAEEPDWSRRLTLAAELNDEGELLDGLRGWTRDIRALSERQPSRMAMRCFQLLGFLSGPALAAVRTTLGAQLREAGARFGERLPIALTPSALLQSIERFVDELQWEASAERNSRKVIRKALQLIKEAYADPGLNLEMLAHQVYLHPTYFSELFKETTGRKFIEYVTEVRLEEARRMLRETDMKMYEVACAVGYTSPKYFGTLFRKRFGVTPMEYREKGQ
ncbi:response regulator [Paenibacillus sp.]|uniref:response regulator n=1 Tax=Paenibacillus sp. TaxID=58172 RepID=UPI0028127695|nr:response regulator [Paenibacillus sp.]